MVFVIIVPFKYSWDQKKDKVEMREIFGAYSTLFTKEKKVFLLFHTSRFQTKDKIIKARVKL